MEKDEVNLFVRIKKYKNQACSLRLSLGKQANEILCLFDAVGRSVKRGNNITVFGKKDAIW